MKMAIVSILSILGLAACAAPPTATSALAYNTDASATVPANRCFRSSQINGHRFADPQTLYLRVGLRDFYRVQTSANCNTSIDPRQTLVTRSSGGSDLVCSPIDFDLRVRHNGGFVSPCFVQSITPLTPQEVAAMPRNLRP